jgi:hypothetical protein
MFDDEHLDIKNYNQFHFDVFKIETKGLLMIAKLYIFKSLLLMIKYMEKLRNIIKSQ